MNDGGPAFPRPIGGDISSDFNDSQQGMTLRDWFAGMAMQGLCTSMVLSPEKETPEMDKLLAKEAYSVADAMLKARSNAPKAN